MSFELVANVECLRADRWNQCDSIVDAHRYVESEQRSGEPFFEDRRGSRCIQDDRCGIGRALPAEEAETHTSVITKPHTMVRRGPVACYNCEAAPRSGVDVMNCAGLPEDHDVGSR